MSHFIHLCIVILLDVNDYNSSELPVFMLLLATLTHLKPRFHLMAIIPPCIWSNLLSKSHLDFSASLAFDMPCECKNLQAFFLYVALKFHLRLISSSSSFVGPILKTYLICQILFAWYFQDSLNGITVPLSRRTISQ